MKTANLSIKLLIPVTIGASILVLSGILLTFTWIKLRHDLYQASKDRLSYTTDTLAYVVESVAIDMDRASTKNAVRRIFENVASAAGVDDLYIVSRDFTIVQSVDHQSEGEQTPPFITQMVRESFQQGKPMRTRWIRSGGDSFISVSPIAGAGAGAGGTFATDLSNRYQSAAVAEDDLTEEHASINQVLLGISVLVPAVAALIGGFIQLLFSSRIIRPLLDLRQVALAVAEGRLSQRASIGSFGEIGEVARAFNHMLDAQVEGSAVQKKLIEAADNSRKHAAVLDQVNRDLHATQAKMVQTARMASLGEMAGGVAHEINNPLATIHLRSRHIQKLLAADPARVKEAFEFAKIIETTAERIAAIVRGLRAFARTGENDPLSRSDLRLIVNDTLQLCSEKFRTRGVELRLSLPKDELWISARAVQISQVMINLLNNAYDAVSDLPERWIHLSIEDSGHSFEISVTDSGLGIPASIRQRLMEPFFTTKEIGKGTGLGLSLSQGIVVDHGGSLTLDISSGNTRFVVTLPKVKETPSSLAA